MSETISRLSLVDDIQNFLALFKQDKEIKYLQKIDRLIESDYIEINSRDFLHDTSGLYDILHESPDEFKTNLISRSGFCSLTKRCFFLSLAVK